MDEARIHATPGVCGGSTPELGLGSERMVANPDRTHFSGNARLAGDPTGTADRPSRSSQLATSATELTHLRNLPITPFTG